MKNNHKYKVIGLMSGTSLDGLDIAYCSFTFENGQWSFELLEAETVSHQSSLLAKLKEGIHLSGQELVTLDVELGKWMGTVVSSFIRDNALQADFIASHGHTIFHQPKKGITTQVGNGNVIAATTGLPVIYDFRSMDVALGGQGAPLVPVGDQLLFGDFNYCLNLGGIANISFDRNGERVAFDICPCNMVLNYLAGKVNQDFDRNGALARSGNLHLPLLQALNGLDFYSQPYPKSLGFEWVNDHVFPLLQRHSGSPEDQMHTFVAHVAYQISKVITDNGKKGKLLITGGGAFNTYLIEQLTAHVSGVEVHIPDPAVIAYKEAIVFGFLGVLRVRGEVNCLASVTGASRDSSGGVIAGVL